MSLLTLLRSNPAGSNVYRVKDVERHSFAASQIVPIVTSSGSTLIANIVNQGGAVTSVVDSAGNTWVKIADTVDIGAVSQGRIAMYYLKAQGSAPVTSVTVTQAASSAIIVNVSEWKGLDPNTPLRASNSAYNGASSASQTALTLTGTLSGDLVIGTMGYFVSSGTAPAHSIGLPFTASLAEGIYTTTVQAIGWTIDAGGTVGPSWTLSPNGSNRGVIAASFVAATPKTASDSGIHSVTESASITPIAGPPLSVHSSTPAQVNTTGLTAVTASFTAPNKALLVAFGSGDSFSADNPQHTIADSGGLVWTLIGRRSLYGTSTPTGTGTKAEGWVYMWSAPTTSSVSRTVTMTQSTNNEGSLAVKVFVDSTGETPTIAALDGFSVVPGLPDDTVNTTVDNAWIWAVASDWAATGNGVYGTGQTMQNEYHVAGQVSTHVWSRTDSTPTASTAVRMNLTGPASQEVNMLTVEIRPAVSASTPIAGSDTGTHSTTETSSILASQTRTDTGAHSVTETVQIDVTLSRTDTGAHSASEVSTNAISVETSDTGTHSASDSSSVAAGISTSDSGTHSVSDTSSVIVANNIAVSDTGAHSVTESVTIVATLSRTDTGAHSVSEVSSNALSTSTSDSGVHSASDTAALAVSVSANDTGAHSVADVSSPQVSVAVTDAGAHNVTESSIMGISRTLTDTGAHSVTEATSLSGSSAQSDTGALSVTETANISVVVSASDSGVHSAAESASVEVPYQEKNLTDSGVHSVAETVAIVVTVATSDSGVHSATEVSTFFKAISASDSGTHSADDSSTKAVEYATSDSGTHSVTESASLLINDAKDLSDAGAHSVSENVSISGTATASDTGTHFVSESSFILKNISLTDGGTHSAADASVVFNDRPAADQGTHTATETASVEIFGVVEKAGSDSGVHGVTEALTIISTTSTDDAGVHSVNEQFDGNSVANYSDSGSMSVVESATIQVVAQANDSGTHSVAETASVQVFEGFIVKVWTGTAFVEAPLRRWNGTEFVEVQPQFWSGTGWS